MAHKLTANNNRRSIFVFDNRNEMADFMVKRWKRLSREAIREKGFFVAALSGGNTPRDFYRELSCQKEEADWDRTHLYLADERLVSLTDTDSNYGMLDDLLLTEVDIPAENRHPVPVQESSPEAAAQKYEEDMRKFFRLEEGGLPAFDLILLGIGKDGHTASIFPGTEALREKERLAVSVKPDESRHNRITLTLPVINSAKNIIFLAAGRGKAAIIKRVVEERDASLPAAMVNPEKGNLSFVLDREASLLLSAKFQCSLK